MSLMSLSQTSRRRTADCYNPNIGVWNGSKHCREDSKLEGLCEVQARALVKIRTACTLATHVASSESNMLI